MSYVAPSVQATGDLITAAIWNQNVVNNMIAVQSPALLGTTNTLASPTGTASGSIVMMGLGSTLKITPSVTGRIIATISGVRVCSAATAQNFMIWQIGTGTAPANGAAATGGPLAQQKQFYTDTANGGYDFTMLGSDTGLSIGTQYWLDLGIATNLGTMSLVGLTAVIQEV